MPGGQAVPRCVPGSGIGPRMLTVIPVFSIMVYAGSEIIPCNNRAAIDFVLCGNRAARLLFLQLQLLFLVSQAFAFQPAGFKTVCNIEY
jgi:hypothetical protein